MAQPEITQRHLRSVAMHQRRRFVTRAEFTSMSRTAVSVDIEALRADQDASADWEVVDPYEQHHGFPDTNHPDPSLPEVRRAAVVPSR